MKKKNYYRMKKKRKGCVEFRANLDEPDGGISSTHTRQSTSYEDTYTFVW